MNPENRIKIATRTRGLAIAAVVVALAQLGLPVKAQVSSTADKATPADTTPVAVDQAPAANQAAEQDEAINLDTFNVTADKAHGYNSTEATTGSRLNSKIQETPFTVNVVNSKFFQDFQTLDLNSQLAGVSSFSPSEIDGAYQLRGFAASTSLVDGFRRIGTTEIVDIDRIEVIKGPAASIYGAIQPGGVVNTITKQPEKTQHDGVEVDAGSLQFFRAAAYSTGPAGDSGKLFYRVDVADRSDDPTEEAFSFYRQSFAAVKLSYKPDANTTANIGAEYSDRYQHPNSAIPFVSVKADGPAETYAPQIYSFETSSGLGTSQPYSQYYGLATNLHNFNSNGPDAYAHLRELSVTGSFEHKFNDVWSIRGGANTFTEPQDQFGMGGATYYPYGTGNVSYFSSGSSPNQAVFPSTVPLAPQFKLTPQYLQGSTSANTPDRGTALQFDSVIHLKEGIVDDRLLTTVDYTSLAQRAMLLEAATAIYPTTAQLYANTGSTPIVGVQNTVPSGLGGFYYPTYSNNPSLYANNTVSNYYNWEGDYGALVTNRMGLWDNRVVMLLGGRRDFVRNSLNNFIPGSDGSLIIPAGESSFNVNKTTAEAGLNVTPIPSFKGLSLFANTSNAFNPQPNVNALDEALPSNQSSGWEFGAKVSLLDDRLTATLNHYAINEKNLLQKETDPSETGADAINYYLLNETATGDELDLNWQVTNSIDILGSYGYVNPIVDSASDVTNGQVLPPLNFLDGTTPSRVPKQNASLAARYAFSGSLRGLVVTGRVLYYSKSLITLGSGKAIGATGYGSHPVYNVPYSNGELPFPGLPVGVPVTLDNTNGVYGVPNTSGSVVIGGVTQYYGPSVYYQDGRQYIFNAPYAVWEGGLSYSFKRNVFGKLINNRIQLNVKNIFNRQYTYQGGTPGAPMNWVASYSIDW